MDTEKPIQEPQDSLSTAGQAETQVDEITDSHYTRGKALLTKRNRLLSNVLIVVGLLLIVVPLVLTALNAKRNQDIIEEYLKQSEQAVSETDLMHDEDVESFYIPEGMATGASPEPVTTSESAITTEPGITGEAATPAAIDSTQTATAPASPSGPEKKPTMSKEEIKKHMKGVLIIDKIDLRMVIMDGVDEETLRVAAGRMPNTGKFDEIGNIVLAGHRSYTLGKYFNRLDELEPGDQIVIQTSKKTLTYEVYKKLIVEPDDFSITNKNGTDKILTLFTCHPVVIASHRLVVHAKQVE